MSSPPGRPAYHFTAPAGWINDPLGVTWHGGSDGGRYELFFQFNPDAPTWVPGCRWGQATSPDLVRWRDPRTALEPGPGEDGCWSGSVAVDDDGTPTIVYTSVRAGDLGRGRIALAHGDPSWRRWTADPGGPVLDPPGPTGGPTVTHFRDPFLWRAGGGWRMAVGAGDRAGRPSVRQYSSPDLRRWIDEGVLVAGAGTPPGGAVWECPQLFPLDGVWVLLVSVWDGEPREVAAAVGDYDGHRLTVRHWQRLGADPLYATTVFTDAAGRRCALSWIRDSGPAEGGWAGMLSVPWVLGLDGDRVTVRPHPDVATLRTGTPTCLPPGSLTLPVRFGPCAPALDVEVRGAGPIVAGIEDVEGAGGRPPVRVPLPAAGDGSVAARLLVDDGVVEVFSPDGTVTAVRTAAAGGPVRFTVAASGPGARLDGLTVHGMAGVLG